MSQFLEKRKQLRIKLDKFKIKYRSNLDQGEPFESNVVNISTNGICFLCNSNIKKHEKIDILFPFQTAKIVLKAEILRIEGREVGAKFIDNSENLDSFVDTFNAEYNSISKVGDSKTTTEQQQYTNLQKKLDDKSMFDI